MSKKLTADMFSDDKVEVTLHEGIYQDSRRAFFFTGKVATLDLKGTHITATIHAEGEIQIVDKEDGELVSQGPGSVYGKGRREEFKNDKTLRKNTDIMSDDAPYKFFHNPWFAVLIDNPETKYIQDYVAGKLYIDDVIENAKELLKDNYLTKEVV